MNPYLVLCDIEDDSSASNTYSGLGTLDAAHDTDDHLQPEDDQPLGKDWSSIPVAPIDMNSPRSQGPTQECQSDSGEWISSKKVKNRKGPSSTHLVPYSFFVKGKDGYRCYGYIGGPDTPGARCHRGVWFVPHRMDGPAYEYTDGSYKYYIHGKVHRDSGPAIYWYKTKERKYFIHGEQIEVKKKSD
jgi:hypothetical protein